MPMTNNEIENKVNAFLIDRLEIEEKYIYPKANLKADLGLTSLDMQEMKIYCKRTFGFLPDRQDIAQLNVLEDVYVYIENKLSWE